MDMRIACCVLAAFVVVEARFPHDLQCRKYCRYGFVPGTFCECNVRPGGYRPGVSSCHLKDCGIFERCVESYGRARCIPTRPSYPYRPFGGSNSRACYQPEDAGHCRASYRRYFYNSNTQRCQLFIYSGCGGNRNNFETLQDCHWTCQLRQDLSWF